MLCRLCLLLLVPLLVPRLSIATAAPATSQIPPSPQTVFGGETVAIMTGASRVETFRIGGESSDGLCLLERRRFAHERYGVRNYREIAGYPITVVGHVQGSPFASRLKQALFDLPTYPYNGVSCFNPGVVFRVWKGGETVEMIVCFACDHQVVITRNVLGHVIHRVDVINSPLLLSLAAEAFPQDQELQTLKQRADNPPPAPKPWLPTPPNPNEAISDALIRAAHDDSDTALRMALAKIGNINAPGINGELALVLAVQNGDLPMVRELLDKGLSADGVEEWKGQALGTACGIGETDIVRLLFERGAKATSTDSRGETVMMRAAGGGSVDIMRFLLTQGARLDDTDSDGETLLTRAAGWGRLPATQFLLDRGLDVNARTKAGETALTEAAARDHADVVRLLLDKGVAIDAKNNQGETALIEAAKHSNTDVIALLLTRRADIQVYDVNGDTALMAAAQTFEHPEDAQLLIKWGADVNAADPGGDTPLMLAVPHGEQAIPMVRLLLAHGANVHAHNKEGDTAFRLSFDCVPIMQILFEHGAAIDSADGDGDTPLMWAADHDDLSSVQWLLRHHANPHHRDRYGDTALMLAQKDKAAKVIPTLIQAVKISPKRS